MNASSFQPLQFQPECTVNQEDKPGLTIYMKRKTFRKVEKMRMEHYQQCAQQHLGPKPAQPSDVVTQKT